MFSHLERFGENWPMPQARQGLDPFKICKSRVNQIIFALKASRKLRADVDGGGAGSVRNFVSRRRLSSEQFEEEAGRQLINWPPSSKMCQPIPGPGVRAGSETTSEFYFLFFWNRNLTLQKITGKTPEVRSNKRRREEEKREQREERKEKEERSWKTMEHRGTSWIIMDALRNENWMKIDRD